MPINAFDHVNLRTTQLEDMIAFYEDILGMTSGWRPDFPFPGAWLYLGDQALVHLVAVDGDPQAAGDVTLEHFALRATGKAEFIALLEARGIRYDLVDSPVIPVIQINFWDPDGNHIHVDFSRDE